MWIIRWRVYDGMSEPSRPSFRERERGFKGFVTCEV
jgi:hypothetical protein